MQIIHNHPFSALVFETDTTLSDLNQHVGHVARDLAADALASGLDLAGPVYWVYEGADGRPDTRFHLTIAQPVLGTADAPTRYTRREMPPFASLQQLHDGPWPDLCAAYQSLIGAAMQQNLKLSGVSRELYIQMDWEHPQRNVTLVQLGVDGMI